MLHFHRYAAPFLLFLRALAVAQESGGCRFSNGTLLPGTQEFSQYAPCAETGNLATVCCALIRGNEPGGNLSMGATRDECLPNGICQNRWTQSKDGLPVTAWFINYCTDNTEGRCANVCDTGRITPCTGKNDSDRWCCGESDSCCKANTNVVTLAQVLGGGIVSSVSSVSIASTVLSLASSSSVGSSRTVETVTKIVTTTTISSPKESAPRNEKTRSLGGGAIAGIVIGAVAGIGLIGFAFFFARRGLRRKPAQTTIEHGPVIAYAQHAPTIHEMESAEKRPELHGRSAPIELSSEIKSSVFSLPSK